LAAANPGLRQTVSLALRTMLLLKLIAKIMKKSFLTPIVTFIFFISLQFSVKAEEVCMTSCDWAPYFSKKLPAYGFSAEIIHEAFKRTGYTVTFKSYPWKRAVSKVDNGRCDAFFSAYYSEERNRNYALSAPYAESPFYFCTLKNKNLVYKELRDLAPYRIGVVMGYTNTPEFDAADYLKKDSASSDLLNIKKLIHGRVDLIVIDKYVAMYHLKNSPYFKNSASRVRFLEPPLKIMPVHAAFSKAVPGYEKKVRDFNSGLKEIKSDGTIEKILRKHGIIEND
jgi:ABC-type amino acid transport substrate-binding protein